MKTPELKDFNLKMIKIKNTGKVTVKWSFIYPVGNEAHTDYPELNRTLPVHNDLFRLLEKQKENILKAEEINYNSIGETLKKLQVDHEKEILQATEGAIKLATSKMIVTGISLSGVEDRKSVNITYKKMTANNKLMGKSTASIVLSGNTYGFEEELEKDVESIIKETYDYIYNNKHADSEQYAFEFVEQMNEKTKDPDPEKEAKTKKKK